MKKLLSLLSISTLTASLPTPLFANTTPERPKRDINKPAPQPIRNKRQNDEIYNFEIKGLKKVRFHFGDRATWTATRLIEVNINKKDNNDLNYKLPELKNLNNLTFKFIRSEFSNNKDKQEKIQKLITTYGTKVGKKEWVINKKITIRAKGTILNDYKQDDNITDYILMCTNDFEIELDSIDWTKQQSQFNLVDSIKTKTWTRNEALTVDGELNIAIANPNIDKVIFDNVQQSQTNKQWNINVKPETAPRDHNLQVFFTLDGKKYTSEIMVSMLAKIEPTITPVKKQLSELIKKTEFENILDNNDDTIFLAVNKANNNIIDDFAQLKIESKMDNEATLKAKPDSKSYRGSVFIKYNVTPATAVDLKIELQPTATNGVVVDNDYLAQLDSSKITNKVDTFYYASSESVIKMVKPTASSAINGVVYGLNDKWVKNGQHDNIDITKGIKLDGSQLGAVDGKYLIELKNELNQTNTIYLQISNEKALSNYFNTDKGKNFEQWAEDNGYKNIRGSSASQLNKLFVLSKTWKQSLAHLDLRLDSFVLENIKNVTQDEINTYKTKLLTSVKAQVEKYVPDVVENTDYKILADNLVAGDWTTSKDVIVQSVEDSTKLLSFTAKTILVQEKEQPVVPVSNTERPPAPDNKDEDSKLWIIGVVVGVLAGVGIVYLLFRKFIFNKYILPKIYARRQQKVVEQWKRDDCEEAEEQAHKQAEREQKQNKQNNNNQDSGDDE